MQTRLKINISMVIEFFSKTALFQYDVTGEGWEIYRNSQISVTDFPYFLNSSRSAAVWACIFAFHLWKWILHFIPYCYEWEIAQLVYGEICITPLLLSNTFEISWRNWSLISVIFVSWDSQIAPHPTLKYIDIPVRAFSFQKVTLALHIFQS